MRSVAHTPSAGRKVKPLFEKSKLDHYPKYLAHELTLRARSDSVETLATALADAQVDLNPHQVEAVLFAFNSPRDASEKLLNNFDQEVIEKVRMQSHAVLDRFNDRLWQLTRHALRDHAEFSEEDHSFGLRTNPFPDEAVHPGPYRMGQKVEDANTFRVGHILAQSLIAEAQTRALPSPGFAQSRAIGTEPSRKACVSVRRRHRHNRETCRYFLFLSTYRQDMSILSPRFDIEILT